MWAEITSCQKIEKNKKREKEENDRKHGEKILHIQQGHCIFTF